MCFFWCWSWFVRAFCVQWPDNNQRTHWCLWKYKDKCIKPDTSHSGMKKIPLASKEAATKHGAFMLGGLMETTKSRAFSHWCGGIYTFFQGRVYRPQTESEIKRKTLSDYRGRVQTCALWYFLLTDKAGNMYLCLHAMCVCSQPLSWATGEMDGSFRHVSSLPVINYHSYSRSHGRLF